MTRRHQQNQAVAHAAGVVGLAVVLSTVCACRTVPGETGARSGAPIVLQAKLDAEGLSQFLAPVSIAGHNFWCTLDSGGSWVLALDSAKARSAGLQRNATGWGAGAGPDIARDERVRGVAVAIGDIVLPDTTIVLRPQPGLLSDVDCVFGLGLLQDYAVELDYMTPRLRIFKHNDYEPAPGARMLPFELDRFRNPYVDAQLTLADGAPVSPSLVLDTGASTYSAVLVKRFIDAHAIAMRVGRVVQEVVHTPGVELSAARIRELHVGGITIADPVIGLIRSPSAGVIEDGMIGAGFFRRFTVTFDYTSKQLWLLPNSRVNERQPFDASGLDLAYTANRELMINRVAPDSAAAAAHLSTGDHLLAIDDRDAQTMSLREVKALLSRPGVTCVIRVSREGATRTVTLRLAERL